MIVLALWVALCALLVGFGFGYLIGHNAVYRMVVAALDSMITAREDTPSTAAMMELPGLTLFRSIIRLWRFRY